MTRSAMEARGSCPAHPAPGECAEHGCSYWEKSRAVDMKVAAGLCPVAGCVGAPVFGELCAEHAARLAGPR